jgi:hypothetical protein
MVGLRYATDVIKGELKKVMRNKKTPGTEAPEVLIVNQEVNNEEC